MTAKTSTLSNGYSLSFTLGRLLRQIIIVMVMATTIFSAVKAWRWVQNLRPTNVIAPLFTAPVMHWAGDIQRWAQAYRLDPNLLATVMQIESCGDPTVSSYAGAQGLFQVMPFHFSDGEVQLDPETNAQHGASFLQECMGYANGDPALAMACYNGGPSVTFKPFTEWHEQTQRYYIWGLGIYTDAQNQRNESAVLSQWLDAGGAHLCQRAGSTLGL